MRAIFTSSMKSPMLFHWRTMPSAVGLLDDSVGTGPLPSSAASTAPIAPDETQCAHGYSGCIGVAMNGDHPRSAGTLVAPATCSLRIAVAGGQELWVYFAWRTGISASCR